MLKTIDWLIILAYIILTVTIGLKFKNKAGKNLSEFFLGGRKLPWWLAGLSMVATTFAADTPLAVTEIVRKNGIAGNWLWWNFLIGGMLTTFFFAKLWRKSGVLTELELIKIRYSNKEAKFLRLFRSVYISLFLNTIIIAWVNIAFASILKIFFNIQNDLILYSLVFGAMFLAALYSTLSGLMGVAVTDAIQFFIAITGSIILAVYVINSHQIGGIVNLTAKLNPHTLYFLPSFNTTVQAKTFTLSIGAFIAYGLFQWWASWYPGAEPGGGGYIAQRMLSTKNEKHSVYATMFFQIMHYAVRPWPWILVALASIIIYPELADPKIAYVLTMRDFLPTGLKGLMLAAFLAAYMSTISTQLNFGASLLTNDFLIPLSKKEITSKKAVVIGKLSTIVIMIISLIITTKVNSISGLWKFIIQCGAGFGLVLILRWYWWRINAFSEISAMIAPFFFYAFSVFILKKTFPTSYFITIGGTTITWLIVTFATKPTDKEKLQKFYNKVEPQGWWKPFSNEKKSNDKIIFLLIAWISSVIFIYSVLFLSGKLLLHNYHHLTTLTITTVVSLILTIFAVNKSKIF